MARDIEEFLKRAAERRRQQQQPSPAPAPPPQQQAPPPQQQAPPPQRRQPAPPPKRQPILIDDVEVIDDPYAGESVAEHVQQYISTEDIADHAKHLGQEVAQRDDKVDERIHRKFDHEVGHLNLDARPSVQDTTTSVTETEINQTAAAIFQTLMNPESVAQSIMIAEILKRPEL